MMDCKECRDIVLNYAESLVDQDQNGTQGLYQSLGPEDAVSRHLSECPRCAAFAEALRLGFTEGALKPEVSDQAVDRITSSVMDRIEDEKPHIIHASFTTDNKDKEDERPHSPRFGRYALHAAAAVLLVFFSVSVTLMVTGRGGFGRTSPGMTSQSMTAQGESNDQSEPGVKQQASAETKQPGVQEGNHRITVHLTLEAPEAENVAVVGDWNKWDPEVHQMRDENGDGIWELSIHIEEGGEYQYQFLINGEKWIPDPKAPLKVKDGFGGTNSILDI